MGFSARGERDRKKGGSGEIPNIIGEMSNRVALRIKGMRKAEIAVAGLKGNGGRQFEVNEKAVVLALDLAERLGTGHKALDGWGKRG
ncbi:MAG: hypothetical protein QXH30_02230 [Candidatus Bilamarchaeaceae archaeon]